MVCRFSFFFLIFSSSIPPSHFPRPPRILSLLFLSPPERQRCPSELCQQRRRGIAPGREGGLLDSGCHLWPRQIVTRSRLPQPREFGLFRQPASSSSRLRTSSHSVRLLTASDGTDNPPRIRFEDPIGLDMFSKLLRAVRQRPRENEPFPGPGPDPDMRSFPRMPLEPDEGPASGPATQRPSYAHLRHATADFTEADDDEDDSNDDQGQGAAYHASDERLPEDEDGDRRSSHVLPLFSASHLGALPVGWPA